MAQEVTAVTKVHNRGTDLGRRVFLNEMRTGNRHFPLVRPCSGELSSAASEQGPRLGRDEHLGYGALREPVRIPLNDDGNVRLLSDLSLREVRCSITRSFKYNMIIIIFKLSNER